MVDYLNADKLPNEHFAEFQVHVGSRVEVDVATLKETGLLPRVRPNGATATLVAETCAPPAADAVMPAVFPDDIEVQVYGTATGATLVAAIELVSPGNKDRDETRRAFVAKCASYLQQGIGLIVVDIVTNRHANLHNDLIQFLGHVDQEAYLMPAGDHLYGVAYRPHRTETADQIELWKRTLSVGNTLPVLPLALRGSVSILLDLEATYTRTRQQSRLPVD